jgi:hypothetical protein
VSREREGEREGEGERERGRERLREREAYLFSHIYCYSDYIRMLLLSQYGGWYSDLDMVIIKNMSELRNVVASDAVSQHSEKVKRREKGIREIE